MIRQMLCTLLYLGAMLACGSAGEKPVPARADLTALQGEWISPHLPNPGSADGAIERTLEIGRPDNPESIRLSWSLCCGRTRITGGDDFAGRLIGVENKEKQQFLVFAGEKGTRYEVEFELSGNTLQLKGAIKGVDVSYHWARKPVPKKK